MAEELRAAMEGFGTDEAALIDILAVKTYEELEGIRAEWAETYPDRDLIKDIKSETSGNFEKTLVGLATPRAEYDAAILEKALTKMNCDEDMVFEVMCMRTNEELQAIAKVYEEKYEDELATKLEARFKGNREKLMLKLLDDEDEKKDDDDVAKDIAKLYKAGPKKKFGTDEGVFIRMLGGNNREYREKLYWAYGEEYGKNLASMIKSEFSGDLETALVLLVQPTEIVYVEKLWKAMDGLGTDESTLTRILVTQKERNLQKIAERYLEEKERTLEDHIGGETSGNFKKTLLAVCDNWAKLGE